MFLILFHLEINDKSKDLCSVSISAISVLREAIHLEPALGCFFDKCYWAARWWWSNKKWELLPFLSKDMMSPYFLRPLETLFWCPAECQNQSRRAKLSSFTQRFLNQLQSPTAPLRLEVLFCFRPVHSRKTLC